MSIDMSKVYPWIKSFSVTEDGGAHYITAYADNGKEGRRFPISEDIPWHVFGGDVGVFYVLDTADSFTVVQYSMLSEGVTEEELYNTACRNLWRDVEFTVQPTRYGGWGVVCGGNFEASGILMLDVMNTIGEKYGGEFYFAVPARDMMISAADNDEQLNAMEQMIEEIMTNGDSPLSRTIFRWNN